MHVLLYYAFHYVLVITVVVKESLSFNLYYFCFLSSNSIIHLLTRNHNAFLTI